MTPTLKLRRRVVLDHFADAVESRAECTTARRPTAMRDGPGGRRERVRGRRRAHVRRRVPGVVEARDLHDVAGVRRVDELAAADVDADVAEPVEEHEVAGLELIARDVRADRAVLHAALCGSETPTCA